MTTAVVFAVAATSTGCLYRGGGQSVEPTQLSDSMSLVEGVPIVHQQTTMDCGAAALAAVLEYWGHDTSPQQIRRETGAANETIRAGDLRDHARSRGFDAFVIRGNLGDLKYEVEAGRPVLVGMNKPYVGGQWLAHYEVVTGIGATAIVTMDPAHGWRSYSTSAFEREWGAADHVMLIVAPPPRSLATL